MSSEKQKQETAASAVVVEVGGGNLDDMRARPPIAWGCWRCNVTVQDVAANRVIVSPTGAAHYGLDGGRTKCGIEATGHFWWWPL